MGIDKLGFILWEVLTLVIVIFSGIGFLILRRKALGKPAFSKADRQLFFGQSRLTSPQFAVKFALAILLCFIAFAFEVLTLRSWGPAFVTVIVLLTSLGIVHKMLFRS